MPFSLLRAVLALLMGIAIIVAVPPHGANAAQTQPVQTPITAIAYSPDGNVLAAGLASGQIVFWNAQTGGKVRTLSGHSGLPVTGLSFSSDSQTLTSVGRDSVVRRWAVASGEPTLTLTGHQSAVRAVATSADDKLLATGGEDTRVLVWDLESGKLAKVLEGHQGFVDGLAFGGDGSTLLSGGEDRRAILWNSHTGKARTTLSGVNAAVTAVAVSTDGQTFATAIGDGALKIWSAASGKAVRSMQSTTTTISSLSFSPDGAAVIGASGSNIVVWDVKTGQQSRTLAGAQGIVTGVAFSPSGKSIAGADAAGEIILFNAETGQMRRTLRASVSATSQVTDATQDVNATLDAAAVASASAQTSADEAVAATKVAAATAATATEKVVASPTAGIPNRATSIEYSADGATLAIALADGKVSLVDAASGKTKRALDGHRGLPATGLMFAPDGKTLSTVGRDSVLRQWNVATGKELRALSVHESAIRSVAGSADGKWLATGGEDTRIAIWNTATGKLARMLEGHVGFVNALAFSPATQILASGGEDARIILWNPNKGEQKAVLLGHAGPVTALQFSPNGKILASVGKDHTARLWNVASGRQMQILQGASRSLKSIAFSPDGTRLVGGGDDGLLYVWNTTSGKLVGALRGAKGGVTAAVFSRDGKIVAAADNSGQVMMVDSVTGKSRLTLEMPAAVTTKNPIATTSKALATTSSATRTTTSAAASLQTAAVAAASTGPISGRPILLITSAENPFSTYYAEILQNEGLNSFNVSDVGNLSSQLLTEHDLVLLGEVTLSAAQVTMLTDWVMAGGNLIAMRPDKQLSTLLGLTDAGTVLADAYLLADTSRSPGNGIIGETIQYHGSADRYTLNGATSLAALYSNSTTATGNPAVTLHNVGSGQAAAFTYDLARSVVYSHQGNPDWAAEERDGYPPIRSDDKYFGNASGDSQADWIDLNKVAIPQADEQQRLLANLIITMNLGKKPLPRFWYLPHAYKAVVVMTGDDHGNAGTIGRFNQYEADSPSGCSIADWECVRGTSYIFTNTQITDAQAAAYRQNGFEIALHLNTYCGDYTPSYLDSEMAVQMGFFTSQWPSAGEPRTGRHHCIVWSDWVTGAEVAANYGIRLDTSYYYWPPAWINNRPGLFTGSAMPMRYAALGGTAIDVYQAPTVMTDESGQVYPYTVNTLLDRALGTDGFYGAYVVNAHTDFNPSSVSDAVVSSAQARGVPIISSEQLLTWLDGRNGSAFESVAWSGSTLTFTIAPGSGATGLVAMVPYNSNSGLLQQITANGTAVNYTTETIKGISYAVFPASSGTYVASYFHDAIPPTVLSTNPANGTTSVSAGASINATFSEAMDVATISENTFTLRDSSNSTVSATVSYDAGTHTATLAPAGNLAFNTTYTATVEGGQLEPRVKDASGNAMSNDVIWTFTTAAAPCAFQACTIWSNSTVPGSASFLDPNALELGVKFTSNLSGVITGIRFYKGSSNTGTHIGTLWNAAGTVLAQANFSGETSSGWQQVTFATPVAITANTVYVASYHTNVGYYAANSNYFATAPTANSPLTALQDGTSGGNGVYLYGAHGFPTNSYHATNYWVDVLFQIQ